MRLLVVLCCIVLSVSVYGQSESSEYYGGALGKKLDWVMFYLSNHYVDSLDGDNLTNIAIRSMMAELDPWSKYQTAKELKDMKNANDGYTGEAYGFSYFWVENNLMVTFVSEGGPADRAGLNANDRILKVNNQPVTANTYESIEQLIHNETINEIEIDIQKPDKQQQHLIIVKALVPLKSVEAAYMENETNGYVKLSSFTKNTLTEFNTSIKPMMENGLQNLVIDLRGNYGGIVNAAIDLADQFTSKDKLISFSKGYNLERKEYHSNETHLMKNINLTILIDGQTMSAAEMFAAAMQDWDRALIIGKESYGKGLIQQSYKLEDSSAVRMTIGRYYTPAGRYLDRLKHEDDNLSPYLNEATIEHSIQLNIPDSLLKTTLSGRKIVASPRGIVPDIYITKENQKSKEHLMLNGQNILYKFACNFMFNNRLNLQNEYDTPSEFLNDAKFEGRLKATLISFIKAEIARLKFSEEFIPQKISPAIIADVKAWMAGQLWDNSAYYLIVNKNDIMINKAIESFSDGSFQQLKITAN